MTRGRALLLPLALVLAGCSALSNQAQQPLPTVVLATGATPSAPAARAGGLTASGRLVPAQEARLSFSAQERVVSLTVGVGDRVAAGQVLARLDDSALRAQIRQAEASLAAARANLDLLAARPTAAQVSQAEAAVLSAQAAYSRTAEAARPATVAAARAALDAATRAYDKVRAGPQPADYAAAEAGVRTADAGLRQAQAAYDDAYRRNPAAIGAHPAALALEQATNAYQAARAALDRVAQPADAAQVAAAYQQVSAARSALDAATSPAREYELELAQGQLDAATAARNALMQGARPELLAAARAQADAAAAAKDALDAQLPRYTLVSPINGVVLSRAARVGEIASPGSPVLVIGDVERLRAETTDLSERVVANVDVGRAASVFIPALNQTVNGRVSAISLLANTLGGDVVYTVDVELDSRPPGARAGMTVEVTFTQGR